MPGFNRIRHINIQLLVSIMEFSAEAGLAKASPTGRRLTQPAMLLQGPGLTRRVDIPMFGRDKAGRFRPGQGRFRL